MYQTEKDVLTLQNISVVLSLLLEKTLAIILMQGIVPLYRLSPSLPVPSRTFLVSTLIFNLSDLISISMAAETIPLQPPPPNNSFLAGQRLS